MEKWHYHSCTPRPWIFIGRTNAKAEAPILWPLHGHLMQRADSLEKILMLGKIEGRRRSRRQDKMVGWPSPTQWTWIWANSRRQWKTGILGMLQSMGSQRVGHNWVTEQQLSREIISAVTFSMYFREGVWHGWLIKSNNEGWSKWWHNMPYFITQYIWVFNTKFSFINKYHGKYLFSIFNLKPKQKIIL